MIQNVILGGLLVVILGVLILILKRLSDVKHQTEDTGQDKLDSLREDVSRSERQIKEEVRSNQRSIDNTLTTRLESVRKSVDNRLDSVRTSVDSRLKDVHETAGAMQNLVTEVGDVKKILLNPVLRGIFGETQLESLLKQFLAPGQYSKNVKLDAGSKIVDFAIGLPGNNGDPNSCIWLPIDSKFPIADYQRILDAVEKSDKNAEKAAVRKFRKAIGSQAKSISQKYISPPDTTDFAIMFLPTEGLYAEVLRQPGQVEELLQNHRIIVAGPTNLAAIVISLCAALETLSIQKNVSEITKVLRAVKTEFKSFDGVIEKLQDQLDSVTNTVEDLARRKRVMGRKLREFEELPQLEAAKTLGLPEAEIENELSEE